MHESEILKSTALLPWEKEDEYVTLTFLPMAMRYKLDRVGFKLHLKQWQAFPKEARQALLALPCESPANGVDFTLRLRALTQEHIGEDLEPLPARLSAEATETPEELRTKLLAMGFDLRGDFWKQASAYSRYLLTKVGLSSKSTHHLTLLAQALNLPRL